MKIVKLIDQNNDVIHETTLEVFPLIGDLFPVEIDNETNYYKVLGIHDESNHVQIMLELPISDH